MSLLKSIASVLKPETEKPDHVYGCPRCGRSRDKAKGHVTWHRQGNGCSPLCEDCWQSLTVAERMPYYMQLVDRWEASRCPTCDRLYTPGGHADERRQIAEAVLAGL